MRALASILLAACATVSVEKPEQLGASLPAPLSAPSPLPSLIQGRVAVVDLWASWCAACKETMPKLARLEQSYDELVVAGINVGESADTARRFAAEAGITYPIYVDPDFAFADSLEAREVPTLLVFDKTGRIVARANEVDRDLLALLKKLMSE